LGTGGGSNRLRLKDLSIKTRGDMDKESQLRAAMAKKVKLCSICKEEKDIFTFQKKCTSSDGYATICKPCGAAQDRQRRLDNTEKYREKDKRRYQNHTERKKVYKRLADKKKKHPERVRAKQKLKYYMKSGKIIKPTSCNVCHKERPIDGHHEDYNDPLGIIWLCKPCHTKHHIGKTERADEIRKIVKALYNNLPKGEKGQ
jgi:hypothetical protein